MLLYIIQVILFQILFLLVYDVFLSRETFFTKNRLYLLASVITSFVLPLIKIKTIQKIVSQDYSIFLPEIVLSPQTIVQKQEWYQSIAYWSVLYWLGACFFFVLFVIKLFKIFKLVSSNRVEKYDRYKLIYLKNSSKAFSFFNYICLGDQIPVERRGKIIQHELVHTKQLHTLDLLFFELLKIFMWFNPLLWAFQNRISTIHEFLSDETASKSIETKTYINSLFEQVFQVENISFVNQFYKKSMLKKRIIMMTKQRSKRIKQLKYLLLAPVLFSMLLYSACSDNDNILSEGNENTYQSKISVYGKDYILKTTENNNLLEVFNENGERININEILPEHKFYYDEEGYLVCEFLGGKIYSEVNSIKTKDFYAFEFKKEAKNVPFSQVDKTPSFKNNRASKESFNQDMRNFISQNFDMNYVNSLGLKSGLNRIFAQFKIDEVGNIIDVKVRAPHPELKEYTKSILNKMPQLVPGKKDGEIVKVGYTLPITFEIK